MLNRNKKNQKDRRGQIAEGMLWLVRILFIVVPLILAIAFFVRGVIVTLDATPTETVVLAERAVSCFSAEFGVLSAQRFNSDELSRCYSFGEHGAVGAKLFFGDDELRAETSQFSLLEPLCGLPSGANVPYCKEFRKYVLVEKEGTLYPGSLDIKITLKKK